MTRVIVQRPSYVLFSDNGHSIGDAAKNQVTGTMNPINTYVIQLYIFQIVGYNLF